MNQQAFIDWALDPTRTLEERFTLEMILEQGVNYWEAARKIFSPIHWEARREHERQRSLNPAYQPRVTEKDVRRTAEMLPAFKSWWNSASAGDRPMRDLSAFGFMLELTEFSVGNCEATDISVFTRLPKLRALHFASADCTDFSPLAECRQLRDLGLTFGKSGYRVGSQWPKVAGLEQLTELETLCLSGNLLVFPPGTTWPKVRTASLQCDPLAARSVRELPQLPACEILTLAGVERLDGIEAFPRLRNLNIITDTRDFEPLTALKELTALTCSGFAPVDVAPLARLPRLQCLCFNANYKFVLTKPKPRDFSPLVDAPALRELCVTGCPPVVEEVKTLQALLQTWDDLMLAAEPRPVPPLRMIIASKHPQRHAPQFEPGDNGIADAAVRQAQGQWLGRFLTRAINQKMGCSDWGTASGEGLYRGFSVEIHAFALVEKSREILEAAREAIACLRHDYVGTFWIRLQSPVLVPTPAQVELEKKFRQEQDEAQWERDQQDRLNLLERQHRLELKKQLGEEIKPEEFIAPAQTPLPPPPWEKDEDEDEDETDGIGGIALKEKVEPPPNPWDNEHPLADEYSMLAALTLTELWVWPHHRDVAVYLMRQEPDEVIPDPPKPE